jgi:hypothetical protein
LRQSVGDIHAEALEATPERANEHTLLLGSIEWPRVPLISVIQHNRSGAPNLFYLAVEICEGKDFQTSLEWPEVNGRKG